MKIDLLLAELGDVWAKRHLEHLCLLGARRHQRLFRHVVAHLYAITDDFLREEGALGEPGELQLERLLSLLDPAEHEVPVVLDTLWAKVGALQADPTQALDGIHPQL